MSTQVLLVQSCCRFRSVRSQPPGRTSSIPICEESATGENIFKLQEAELASCDVPWTNCLALGCDNAPVMTGANKGVIAFVHRKHPNVGVACTSFTLRQRRGRCLCQVWRMFWYTSSTTSRKVPSVNVNLQTCRNCSTSNRNAC